MLAKLSDVLVALTYPPTLSACIALMGAAALLLRRRRTALMLWVAAVGWTGLWSIPLVSEALRDTLEERHALVEVERLPRADAIVVLGGGQYYPWLDEPHIDPRQLRYSRVATGARAWLAGRAPMVILSGGGARGRTEAGTMARAIQRLGVPADALLLEDRSRDTRDNARNTAAIAQRRGYRRILLVTSAVHMPRARRLFTETGLQVVPVPVPETRERVTWHERLRPSPGALRRSGRALKEYLALAAIDVRD